MAKILILIPAAGYSARMRGQDKLMQIVDGQPLLLRQTRAAMATGHTVAVTLNRDFPDRAATLGNLNVAGIPIDDPSEGMSASLRAGASYAMGLSPVGMMVFLPDLPDLTTDDLNQLIAQFVKTPDTVIQGTAEDGTPGHPVIFPARLFDAIAKVSGDNGAKEVMRSEQVTRIPLPGQRATEDLDTPEAWARWQHARGET